MSRTLAYAASCIALVLAGVAVSWPLLGPPGRRSVLAAGLFALPLQVLAFAALQAGWGRSTRFFAALVAGVLLRLLAVFAGALVVIRLGLVPAPALLGLAAFFLAMLFMEPFFLARDRRSTAETLCSRS